MTDDATAIPLFEIAGNTPKNKGKNQGIVGPITIALEKHVSQLRELDAWDTEAELNALVAKTVAMQLDAGVGHYSLAAVVKSLAELVDRFPRDDATTSEDDELTEALRGLGDGRHDG